MPEAVGEDHQVDRVAVVVDVDDRLEDLLVGVEVEVVRRRIWRTSLMTALSRSMVPRTLRSASRLCGGSRSGPGASADMATSCRSAGRRGGPPRTDTKFGRGAGRDYFLPADCGTMMTSIFASMS